MYDKTYHYLRKKKKPRKTRTIRTSTIGFHARAKDMGFSVEFNAFKAEFNEKSGIPHD